ncbi:MAG TPA: aminotransferase class V-fold PLP-dependent enzyme [Candidatus Deferrimicrobium sp.]|nr:aminotransferase class V-fold PLP-dependent enzyme [Candidatus Deferrimicrobium sp.]
MEINEFKTHAHELVDWVADYLENVREYPVKSQVQPQDIIGKLPTAPPENGEPFDQLFNDFRGIILPGMTHWQHPRFFAYFPANSSPPSLLAEMLTAAIGAQCMNWQTSPAATELEERMMQWLRQMIGLPEEFVGVIQDTASTATLCSILTARERASGYAINERGFGNAPTYAVYCSTETHSSIEKAVKIAGLGKANLRKVEVDADFAMKPQALEHAIQRDRRDGIVPLCVVATLGTTGSTAIDPLRKIGEICRRYEVWLHVDAAYAGTALLLPEMRWMSDGVELADTFVFNPHKWMLTNFDCSAYFVKDKQALVRTFEIMPEYLKTAEDKQVNNYRDWGIALGRRFRALKLWFVIRSYGVEGLRKIIRNHISLSRELAERIRGNNDFELLAPVPLNLICFRYHPAGLDDPDTLDGLNERLLNLINDTGQLFMTHTKLNDRFTLRMVIGQTRVTREDVQQAWEIIQSLAQKL